MSENPLKWTCDTVENELRSKGYNHLKTAARGSHIVIYTELTEQFPWVLAKW
ncbi:hypothetical protein DFR58_105129 [Anaerobacterium chartisolvens]|uniref:Uncharacterized protein n=1 Tax=Anaerobacterium chartisolvens TaxID=1297424 RepID=A0A369BAL6_9FIRM|nr:hypothetical protein [Anaerobacterium chartisolvens]RCX18365.1 hypothetical protein DFR58_105129 [Anaerobacterium chartisolvens]